MPGKDKAVNQLGVEKRKGKKSLLFASGNSHRSIISEKICSPWQTLAYHTKFTYQGLFKEPESRGPLITNYNSTNFAQSKLIPHLERPTSNHFSSDVKALKLYHF